MQTVVQVQTERNQEGGRDLLRQEPWNQSANFSAGVIGYVAAMPSRTDWLKVREDLMTLIPEPQLEIAPVSLLAPIGTTGFISVGDLKNPLVGTLDLTIAREWGRRNLDAAIDWYAGQSELEAGEIEQRTLAVLQAIPAEDRHQVAGWLEDHRGTGERNDRLTLQYARRLAHRPPDELVERLLAIPSDEAYRAEIVAAFVVPSQKKGKPPSLRHAPEDLRRLIDAGQLSSAERERFLTIVDQATAAE